MESDAAVTKETTERETVAIEGLITMRIGSFSLSSPNGRHAERGVHSEALVVSETAGGKRTHKQPVGGGNRTGASLWATVFPRLASV